MSPTRTTASFRVVQARSRPKATLTTIKEDIVTLRIHDGIISFFPVDHKFEEKVDQVGHGNDARCYEGFPIARLRIKEPETNDYTDPRMHHQSSTMHDMLSDGNIIRRYQPNKAQRKVLDPVDRVYRAILGAILTYCSGDHILDPRTLGANSASTHTPQRSTKFVFNRHDLLKMFYATQPRCDTNSTVYCLRAYNEQEISELIQAAYTRGRAFFVGTISDAQRQAYVQAYIEHNNRRSECSDSTKSRHRSDGDAAARLITLASVAVKLEAEDRGRNLYWD